MATTSENKTYTLNLKAALSNSPLQPDCVLSMERWNGSLSSSWNAPGAKSKAKSLNTGGHTPFLQVPLVLEDLWLGADAEVNTPTLAIVNPPRQQFSRFLQIGGLIPDPNRLNSSSIRATPNKEAHIVGKPHWILRVSVLDTKSSSAICLGFRAFLPLHWQSQTYPPLKQIYTHRYSS